MATDPQDIVDAIDAMILAATSGKTLEDVADRRLAELGITKSTSLKVLMQLRELYAQRATLETTGGGEVHTTGIVQ